jgi:hypothetical protein
VPPKPPAEFTKYVLLATFGLVPAPFIPFNPDEFSWIQKILIVQRDFVVTPGQTAKVVDIGMASDGTGISSFNSLWVVIFNADGTESGRTQVFRSELLGGLEWYLWLDQSLSGSYL